MIWPAVIMPKGYPSGFALEATSLPIMPPAPGLLSTTTGLPSRLSIASARVRVRRSEPPPGPNGTMIWIACCGHSCARDGCATSASESAVKAKALMRADIIAPSFLRDAGGGDDPGIELDFLAHES